MNYKSIIDNIIKSFDEMKNSHAFLFETNNLFKCNLEMKKLIKYICCNSEKNDNCKCVSCKLIDSNQNPDVIEIYPDGKEIKVEQIELILNKFVSKSTFSRYSVYLINNADKLNLNSANKLLKFLEEPNSNIIGFFITDNLQGILPTIKSRCETFYFNFDKKNILDYLNINENEFEKYYPVCIQLVRLLNENKKYLLLNNSKNFKKYDRDEIIKIFVIVKRIYEIKYYNLIGELNYNENFDEILLSIDTNDLKIVVNRLKLLDNILSECNFNVNKELIFNKFFILWE